MRVLNFGSLNIDYVYSLDHIVAPGETITSRGLEVFPGGKGLNQSVALARAAPRSATRAWWERTAACCSTSAGRRAWM